MFSPKDYIEVRHSRLEYHRGDVSFLASFVDGLEGRDSLLSLTGDVTFGYRSRYCPICIPPNHWLGFFLLSLQLRSHLWKGTLWQCKYSAPHHTSPLDLASIDGSCLLQMTAFQCWYCLPIYQSALSLLLLHLFIYLLLVLWTNTFLIVGDV